MRYAGPVEMSAWRMPSISGTSHTVAVMTGESDSGETLSPKNAPVQTAPAAAGSGTPRPCATPMQATPTSSISPACQGSTILFSSMIVVLSRFGWVKLKKDNKKAALSRLGESRFLFTC